MNLAVTMNGPRSENDVDERDSSVNNESYAQQIRNNDFEELKIANKTNYHNDNVTLDTLEDLKESEISKTKKENQFKQQLLK